MSRDDSRLITRREFISRGAGALAGATLLGSLATAASCAKTPVKKPNILFLFSDQHRVFSMGCMGDKEIKTPNMDRLAKEGLLFTHAISGYPLCSPYRAMLLTGRYGTSTGEVGNEIELPASEVTIAKALKQQGYKCGYIGKWHLEKTHIPFVPKERRLGFDDYWASRNLGGSHFDSYYCGDTPEEIPMPGYEPDTQTTLAIDFMKKHKDEPFCLFMSWRPPHPPREAPKKYKDVYPADKLTQRPNVPKGTDDRDNKSTYYAMITDLDDNIGRLTKALDELGIADDTIICFSSDHGDMLASQGLQGKNVPYDESINIPFILRYPRKVKAGGKTDVLLNSVDVMPTLLSLCGAPIPKPVQGVDLSSFVLGKGGKKPESVLLQRILGGGGKKAGGEWRGVRTERYTYAKTRDGGWLLFDNLKDPYQMNNLIGKTEAKDIQAKMEAELQKWLKRVGDNFEPGEAYIKRFKSQLGRKHLRGLPVEE
ncbi:MAG: sulfatase [Armatimonadetes bacterium]|nr:sulfatase [Armatimonadota bacterium]